MMMTSGKHAGKYKNSLDCAQKVLREEGVSALYKGAGSNILRGLAGALVLVGFDYCKVSSRHRQQQASSSAAPACGRLTVLCCAGCQNYYLEWKYPELRGVKKEIKIQFG